MSEQSAHPADESADPLDGAKRDENGGGIDIRGDVRIDGDMVGGNKQVGQMQGSTRDVVGGDKIIEANFGDSHDVVQGNKYSSWTGVKIGTFVLPVRFLIALLAVAAVIAVAAWFIYVPARMPEKTKNIAIADFGQLDSNNNVASSTNGSALSRWLFSRMRAFAAEKENLPEDVEVTVWNDSMNLLEKRANIGIIRSEKEAAQIAEDLQAHIVVYGNLDSDQDLASFVPLFYVNPKLATRAGVADELTGSQQLGRPLSVRYPYKDEALGPNLAPRGHALVWFVRGIGFDLVGEYDYAYQTFCQADLALNDWKENQGREVLYYFLGRAALHLAQDDNTARETLTRPGDWGRNCKPFQNAAEANQDAEMWFTKARDTADNPDLPATERHPYPRAYFGLGEVFRQRAEHAFDAEPTAPEQLNAIRANFNTAIEQYQQVVDLLASMPDPGSFVGLKVRAGLGTSYLGLENLDVLEGSYDRALENFAKAEETLTPLLGPAGFPATEIRNLAQTHSARGAARFWRGFALTSKGEYAAAKAAFAPALEDYEACLGITAANREDEFLARYIASDCTTGRDATRDALAQLATVQ